MSTPGSPWSDLDAYLALPRLGELRLSPDGRTLLVAVSVPNHDRTAYTSAWWRVDLTGERPARRWTRSVEGESAAAFTHDGDLLFASKRDVPKGLGRDRVPPPDAEEPGETEDAGVLWCLPAAGGEAYALSWRVGGWTGVHAARRSGRVVLTADAHVGAGDETEHARIATARRKQKVAAVLHDGFPVRSWDHDLGATDVRLLAADLDEGREPDSDRAPRPEDLHDLTPTRGVTEGGVTGLSDDGRIVLLDWTERDVGGAVRGVITVCDLVDGTSEVVARDELDEFYGGVLSADGRLVVCTRERQSTVTVPPDLTLWLVDRETGEGRPLAADWDAWPTPHALSPDNSTAYVTVHERGHGPLYAVDLGSGQRRRLTADGTVGSVVLSADGTTLYATTSSYLDPGTVVAVDTASGEVRRLRGPVDYPDLPGRLEDVTATADDGTAVRGYLLLPEDAGPDRPAPLALWIHGGPLHSWSEWSWRWCPWLMVARGYAVLLPDPALSTGYGQDFIARGWGRWGAEPYTDLMAITDAVVARPEIDADRTVAMGGSFGGYMANWVAGHTERFRAIVSHASLWNLESFGPTTDAAWYWAREMSPEMMRENSPHHHAARITTPMLVIHGDKDYRVPISEGLALWWALVSGFDGPPEELPHRFLYFPDENHWVLTPQHAKLWYETVLGFVDARVNRTEFVRPDLL